MFRQLLIVAIVAAVLAEPDWSKVHKHHEECTEELGYYPSDRDATQRKSKCFQLCTERKGGLFDEKGELVLEEVNKRMPTAKSRSEKAVEKCNKIVEDDECETADKRLTCLSMEVDPMSKVYKMCVNEMKLKKGEDKEGNKRCLYKCMAQKQGTIDENGAINATVVGEVFPAEKEKIDEAVRKCDEEEEKDDCIQASRKFMCLFKNLKKNL